MTNKLVYLAGPISKGNPMNHTRYAIVVAEELVAAGMTPFVPHLSVFWEFLRPHDKAWWLAYDFNILERCDALLRLPGESEGADKEVAFARALGIPVFFAIDALRDWYRWVSRPIGPTIHREDCL